MALPLFIGRILKCLQKRGLDL